MSWGQQSRRKALHTFGSSKLVELDSPVKEEKVRTSFNNDFLQLHCLWSVQVKNQSSMLILIQLQYDLLTHPSLGICHHESVRWFYEPLSLTSLQIIWYRVPLPRHGIITSSSSLLIFSSIDLGDGEKISKEKREGMLRISIITSLFPSNKIIFNTYSYRRIDRFIKISDLA